MQRTATLFDSLTPNDLRLSGERKRVR
jgi:hypothetical protein